MIRDKHILVAVLNWGLGHATRSIPIIRKLLSQNNHICIASDGAALDLLQSTFPDTPSISLPGYDVTYPTRSMVWNIGSQYLKIKRTIDKEHHITKEWVSNNDVDIILSDNRYGCHHAAVHNILVSHQLNLKVPALSGLINRMHANKLSKFNEIWTPDDENRTLSGALSDPKWLDPTTPVKFIGAQSRINKTSSDNKKYDVAAILSGPEPQRTYLETKLIEQLSQTNLKSIVIQGSKSAKRVAVKGNLSILPFADQEQLSDILCESELIICRSGYSTVMDLAKVNARALFIPTPGQTEQMYLARRFEELNIAQHQIQHEINIEDAWERRNDYSGF